MDQKKLNDLRNEIDILDDSLLATLANRIAIVREIGKVKKTLGLEPLAEERWQQVLQDKLQKAEGLQLSKTFIEKIYTLIHEYALDIEKKNR